MSVHTTEPPARADDCRIRVAAVGDIHVGGESDRARATEAFASLAGRADLVLLAGDLTTHGEPEQAAVLADAARTLELPVVAVLGNHDWHSDRAEALTTVLQDAGIVVLSRDHRVLRVCDTDVGIVGCKGFVGGFTGSHLPDFGEPLLRRVYAETSAEVDALDAGLRAIELCPFRIVLLHYAPTAETLIGERQDIWTFLGTDRLAAPIGEHAPNLVLHGHAHAGSFEGRIGEVPVYNVSAPVMGEDFWIFELTGPRRAPSEIH